MTPIRTEARAILRIAIPAALTQLGMMGLWVIDYMMLRHSVEAQDAAALGRMWISGTSLIGMGLLFGLDPILAQAWGARDAKRLGDGLQQGLFLCLLLSIPFAITYTFTEVVLVALGQNPAICVDAEHYALVQIPSLPLFFGITVLRQFLQARGIVRPAMFVVLSALPLNALLDWVLIHGHLGFPALGVVGTGIATAVIQGYVFLALAFVILKGRLHEGAWEGWRRENFRIAPLIPILAIGLPIGVQLGLELWAFQISTIWSGWLGEGIIELASHNAVMQIASVSFMVPLGIAIGTTTRVGNLIGEGRPKDAQRSAWVAIAMGAGVMALAAALFLVFRSPLIGLYTEHATVAKLAIGILPVAAAFQVFDGIQVVGSGILRGMGRPRPALLFNLVGYYVLALPLGYWLCFHADHGLSGIWYGLAFALFIISILMVTYIHHRGPSTVTERVTG